MTFPGGYSVELSSYKALLELILQFILFIKTILWFAVHKIWATLRELVARGRRAGVVLVPRPASAPETQNVQTAIFLRNPAACLRCEGHPLKILKMSEHFISYGWFI